MKTNCFKYIPALFGRIFNFRIFVFITLVTVELFSGSIISGVITDSEGKPVTDVNVQLHPTFMGSVSDEKGYFYFQRVPDGRYKLIFSHVSYLQKEISVVSAAEDVIKLRVVLESVTIDLSPLTSEACIETVTALRIDPRKMEQTNSNNAEEVLRNVPDLNIVNTDGSRSRVSIRGTDSKHTSVYLDGVLLNSAMDGSFDLKSIPSEIIDTVEIYKAGDLTLTGNSVGGIIKINTKKSGQKREFSMSLTENVYSSDRDKLSADDLSNHNYAVNIKYPFGENTGIFISYSGSKNENSWSYINAAKADEYRYINHPNISRIQTNAYSNSDNIFASVNHSDDSYEYFLGLNYSEYRSGLPGWYDQPYNEAYSKKKNFTVSGSAEIFKKEKLNFDLESSYSFRNDQVSIKEIDELFYTDTDDDFHNFKLKAETEYSSDPFLFRAGSEYSSESAASSSLDLNKRKREIKSLYSKIEYGKKLIEERLSYHASGAVRKDFITASDCDESLFSFENSFEYSKNIFTIIPAYSYSQSYNLPSFSALFWADNLYSAGNPDLKPEYSSQHEFSTAASAVIGEFKFRTGYTYYDKKLEDLIVWIKRTSGKYTPENMKEGRIRGHEISAGADIFSGALKLDASFSMMNAKQYTGDQATDGKYVIYKPSETLHIGVSADHSDYSASFRAKFNGKMYLNETNSIDIYPFWLFEASASKTFRTGYSEISVSADCENIFDEQYQIIYGYPMPGRKISAGLEIKF